MQQLTSAEEDMMQHVWDLGREFTVGDIRDHLEAVTGTKPPHSTISALLRILDRKGFLMHKVYGRTWVYRPTLTRKQYGGQSLWQVVRKYFGGEPDSVVAHLVRKEELSIADLSDLLRKLEEE